MTAPAPITFAEVSAAVRCIQSYSRSMRDPAETTTATAAELVALECRVLEARALLRRAGLHIGSDGLGGLA